MVFTAKRTRLVFTFLSEILRVFEELNDIVFQCVGNRDFDWSEICCCHDNFITCHEKSAAVTNLQLSRSKNKIVILFFVGIAVSGLMLCLKAKELSDDPSFKASRGWCEKWK